MLTLRLMAAGCVAALMFHVKHCHAADAAQPLAALERSYVEQIRPLIAQHCDECHANDLIESQIDLGSMPDFADVRRSPETWQRVFDMVRTNQMPPEDSDPLSAADRTALLEWLPEYLPIEAALRDGDPGRVVLRRLNNAEYTHTIRELTGVDSLDPAREFPVDSAAGEGFTNTGAALVMSPALLAKYFDAAKQIADHVVLLPDGFRFSPSTDRSDWSMEVLTRIQDVYRRHSGGEGGTAVDWRGVQVETDLSGTLSIEPYLAAMLLQRDDLAAGRTTPADVAVDAGLSSKYLATLWNVLSRDNETSLLLRRLRADWSSAGPEDAGVLAAEIGRWQQALWKFNPVGQIGRHLGGTMGPERWMAPVIPLIARQDVRLKLEAPADAKEITLYLTAGNAGDGAEQDLVVWENPRLVAAGRADLPLRDVRSTVAALAACRASVAESVERCLAAAAEATPSIDDAVVQALAKQHDVEPAILSAWLELLGLIGPAPADGLLPNPQRETAGYQFIQGWIGGDALSVVANSSDEHVRIPGNMPPHSVAMHPLPDRAVLVGWRSPVTTTLVIAGGVQHAHPECGNGVTWSLELRRGRTAQQLASGTAQGATKISIGPVEEVGVHADDVVVLVVGPREGNHACDLTAVDLTLTSAEREWDLARDVSSDILAGNPHDDGFGNAGVWLFASEPIGGGSRWPIPAGSLLARWQSAASSEARAALAGSLQRLLAEDAGQPPAAAPDAALRELLTSVNGPLLSTVHTLQSAKPQAGNADTSEFGVDRQLFGAHPGGGTIGERDLCVAAPSLIEVRLPVDLIEGCEFVTVGRLGDVSSNDGSVQLQALTAPPESPDLTPAAPIVVGENSDARRRFETAFDDMRQLFPAALCYARIVPVDEVVTLNLYFREDDELRRLMLNDEQAAELDRLWDELLYISREPLMLLSAYEQLAEYATQDRPDKVIEFAPLREPITARAAAFRQRLIDTEAAHFGQLLSFAERASRRPLRAEESQQLRDLYAELRRQELSHDEAFRLTLARVLVSPEFLYHLERPGAGTEAQPVTVYELASRLSYFLWSSLPDEELLRAAADGALQSDEEVLSQLRRMLADPRAQRMAGEFAAQWLHVYQFDQLDEKSARHFPTFAALRDDMYQETLLFFADLFQNDRSVLSMLDADYTFLNEDLAAHYGIPNVTGSEWRRVEGVQQYGRGGILTQAAPLAQHSGASRTSPILRGNWLSEVVLGEKLPRPPKGVPVLPETPPEGRTERQLIELHSSDPACAKCHDRIDPLGFVLESFDAIGRFRERDAAGLQIDSHTVLQDGTELGGLDGLKKWLLQQRRADFVRQFNKKLLGYALGRSVQFSDRPLLDRMDAALRERDYRVSAVLEAIVLSQQFREIRGAEFAEGR